MAEAPQNCPLCRANNLFKGTVLQSTPTAYLTENIRFPGNYLIIPEDHIERLTDLPDNWWADMKQLLQAVPDLDTNYNMTINIGRTAGQTLPHLHFWIVPRQPDLPSSGLGLVSVMRKLDT